MAEVTQLTADPNAFGSGVVVPPAAPAKMILVGEQAFATINIKPEDRLGELSIPASAHSLQGFREWAASDKYPERGQITYCPEGLIIDMSPELLETHNYVKTDVGFTLTGLVRARELGRYIADRALFSNEASNVSTEPDAMFISGLTLQSGRCRLVKSRRPETNIEVLGSPDWIMEVVSPSSVKKDKVILRDGYFRAGVGEYWIIDALGEELEFQVLVRNEDRYIAVEPQDGWLASPTFGCSFRLTADVDKHGFTHYTLHIQEKL